MMNTIERLRTMLNEIRQLVQRDTVLSLDDLSRGMGELCESLDAGGMPVRIGSEADRDFTKAWQRLAAESGDPRDAYLCANLCLNVARSGARGGLEPGLPKLAVDVCPEACLPYDVRQTPKRVILELTASCSLNCVMCGIGAGGYDPAKEMSASVFRMCCEQLVPYAKVVRLNGQGEATESNSFEDRVKAIARYDVSLEIVTNLVGEQSRIYETLVKHDCLILVSCDAADRTTFERIRRRARWDVFIRNLERVIRMVNMCGGPLPRFLYTLGPSNAHSLKDVVSLAARHGVPGILVNLYDMGDYGMWIRKERPKLQIACAEAAEYARQAGIRLVLPHRLGAEMMMVSDGARTGGDYCDLPQHELFVHYNGELSPCCMMNPVVYGSLKHSLASDILLASSARWFRQVVNTREAPSTCLDCYYLFC